MLNRRQRAFPRENLWNFIEATDFTFNILTGQGTGMFCFILIKYIYHLLMEPMGTENFSTICNSSSIYSQTLLQSFCSEDALVGEAG